MELRDAVVVVTGASRGIGRTLALAFAQEGAKVVVVGRSTERRDDWPGTIHETAQAVASAGGWARAIRCDVSQPDEEVTLVSKTLEEFGHLDVLVNNAGMSIRGGVLDVDPEAWDAVMAANVKGPYLMCRAVLPSMMERRSGNILNISSGAAASYMPHHLVYPASKAALDRFTLNLAEDMREYNIAVNGLRPGYIDTPMNWAQPEEHRRGRTPEPPELVVPAAVWLAQQDAASFTGRIVERAEFGKSWP